MEDARDNIVEILAQSYREAFISRGVTGAVADDMAQRAVHALLDRVGGRKWYIPKVASFEADARAGRDEAIRQAHRRRVPVGVILRTFRVSKRTYYRALRVA